jgi:hypothetical protein
MSPLSTIWRPLLGTIYSIAEHHGTTYHLMPEE